MQEQPETIAIRTPEGRRAVLNASDYDARKHEPWVGQSSTLKPDAEELDRMTKVELQSLARRLYIPGHGSWKTKSALRNGIADFLRQEG